MILTRLILMIAAIFLSHCCSSTNTGSNQTDLENRAKEKFKSGYNIILNDEKDFAVCLKRFKTTPAMPSPPVSFFIYDLNNEKIIYESELANGNIKWKNNYQVEIETIPGTVTGYESPNEFRDIYDVREKKFLEKK